MPDASELARRLRALRKDRGLTQPAVAEALGVSVPLISSWESLQRPVLPPDDRLDMLATVLAGDPATTTKLRDELLGIRSALSAASASNEYGGPWFFDDDADITIVCAGLPERLRATMQYADPSSADYVAAYRYADIDSLFEVSGYIREANRPGRRVKFMLDTALSGNSDLRTHLVLLGGIDWNSLTRAALARLRIPVVQNERIEADGVEVAFEVEDSGSATTHRFAPRFDGEVLVEDVGQFVWGRNPFVPGDHGLTVTICNGMYARGTLGAVRALTDPDFRDANAAYLQQRFARASAFNLLFRVGIFNSIAVTPDWSADDSVLHEWETAG